MSVLLQVASATPGVLKFQLWCCSCGHYTDTSSPNARARNACRFSAWASETRPHQWAEGLLGDYEGLIRVDWCLQGHFLEVHACGKLIVGVILGGPVTRVLPTCRLAATGM